ncbi:peptidase [Sulfurovum sp. bin170]|uniref:M14 family zinc carboxypeptidase n=1 Tax=Sulfurovum sp. bin170 TaxID=2695268 RepID=UPI0013DF17CA|nr:M14 family zinc carboxypeptidase [Sulfurovum sp. bin170]NEW61553.1 peptidase [Sulfurovum sp. bin170]
MKQQYKSYKESSDFLFRCAENYPDLITVKSIGKSYEDRDILLATISLNVAYANLKPALLFTGTVHAREWIGNELGIEFIDYLLKNYNSNPEILNTLTNNTLYLVPCLNPDGFEYSRLHFSFWRKNRRDNGDGTFGVDLNRNFPVGYKKSTNTASNVYGGTEPFSEPETRAMRDFVKSHKNITIALDYHSQGNVFFPAHKFNHEKELEGTDLNTLCANMNYHINKVTGRKYGINRGKPPTKLISGSGREFYYSKGILAVVVEVGTRNIPDYMQNMKESVDENIPALLYALGESRNYSKNAPQRVKNFHLSMFDSGSCYLSWEYPDHSREIYFEIYRNRNNKMECNDSSLIGVTSNREFKDENLDSGEMYFYYIRAVHKLSNTKSPFAPKVKLKTLLEEHEFHRTIFPKSSNIGYVAQKSPEANRSHFGVNSLKVGVNSGRGISYGVMQFDLDSIPTNAIILEAKISLYPLNRVSAKIEKYGEWSLSIVDSESIADIQDYEQVHDATHIKTVGKSIPSEQLTQGIWSHWDFNEFERKKLQEQLSHEKVIIKLEGPTKLPVGRDSQIMVFDLGYGNQGGGLHYRPSIDIKYTVPSQKIAINISNAMTISEDEVIADKLACGFDKEHKKVYAYMAFDLSSLPNIDDTVITEAWIRINNTSTVKKEVDIRYDVEFVDIDEFSYHDIKDRERIEYIGYEVSSAELGTKKRHHFAFDKYSKLALEEMHENNKEAKFIIRPTSVLSREHLINWACEGRKSAKLMIRYIRRRRNAPHSPKNLSANIDKNLVKLSWDRVEDDGLVGYFVVRNRWHKPKNPFDGVKLYAGLDNYTYDSFGSTDMHKYYAVFSYDDVPNYSEGATVEYIGKL